ncbi:class I SAM-dependent methyltransferase [Paenibacillus yanchengensis]|uniref:Class I SAM-dependent methyltransferase n=1 Tax=Paenibacillus yanchengensis TaxID=2035833 RepID=A0ABW4YGW6_9BACL
MMNEDWSLQLLDWMKQGKLLQAVLSQPRRKDGSVAAKVEVKAIMLRQQLHFQFITYKNNQVFHDNIVAEQAEEKLVTMIEEHYRQVLFQTTEQKVQLFLSKKGKPLMRVLEQTKKPTSSLEHNRTKKRIFPEGEPISFLVELGIMSKEGKIFAKKQDKYRQINRFLEMVADTLPALPPNKPLTIVDFGCGKSYLTFALYYMLTEVHGRQVTMVGLDLKVDVIEHCEQLARQLNYEGLRFLVGDIAQYNDLEQVDMVVTLHACDTATDAALAKAVQWGASVIMSVPCCQHQLFKQLENANLTPLLSHGLLKERFTALVTDAARSHLLQTVGYKVQMLEFIDLEHTPKNIMIRATKVENSGISKQKWEEYLCYKETLHIEPALEQMLNI